MNGNPLRIVPATRWLKLLRDWRAEKGRILLMLVAIAVSIVAVGAVMGAYAVLTREIATNYLGTHPAAATLELEGDVDAHILALARENPAVQVAEARDVILARAKVGADWRPLLLFVVDDFASMRLNTITPFKGTWPPATGEMLIERSARAMLNADVGGNVEIKLPHAPLRSVPVSGLVHDPGLAPAGQERSGYGYISRATLAALGEAPVLHELRISVRDANASIQTIESAAAEVGRSLEAQGGAKVHEIRVPPPRQHPHQRQMVTILFMMLAFSVMALVLSGVLVSSSLAAMLARQVREIGVMKTIGARTGQIFRMYAVMIASIGALAVALAVPVGWFGAQVLAKAVSGLLNFNLTDHTVPHWVFAVQALAGILVPLLVAAIPILRTSRMSVRQAIDQFGASTETLRLRAAKLPWPARNALRKPYRLMLTLALLAAGGAMFMTALNVSAGWERNIAKVYETRHYDLELRFHEPQGDAVVQRVRTVPGVKTVEAWGYAPAAIARPGQIDVVRTYPDRGHASFAVIGVAPETRLIGFPVLSGRWLSSEDTDAVVLNHAAAAQLPLARVGDAIALSIDGKPSTWLLAGVVEEIGAAGIAYVTDKAFAQATQTLGRARMLRIATTATSKEGRLDTLRIIEKRLADDGVGIQTAVPLAELRTAMSDHIVILIRSLIAMAVVMATVGTLGLASTMGVSVLERTREFAVMKTVGATPARITRLLIAEALFIGALSWVAAVAISAPLTAVVDVLVGRLGFVAPLPFVMSPAAALAWLVLLVLTALAATWVPARRASAQTVVLALAAL